MSLANLVVAEDYLGNGVITDFPIPFDFITGTAASVTVVEEIDPDTGAATLLVIGALNDYTLPIPPGEADPTDVVFNTAPADGTIIRVRRELPYTQPQVYSSTREYLNSTHETIMDRIVMLIQQLAYSTTGAVTVLGDFFGALPDPAAGEMVLGANAAGDGFEWYDQADFIGPAGATGADGDGFTTSAEFVVLENDNEDLFEEVTDSLVYNQVDYIARVKRGTTVFARIEFSIIFRNGAWEIVMADTRRADASSAHGVLFTVHAVTAQINAAVDNSGAGDADITFKKNLWAI